MSAPPKSPTLTEFIYFRVKPSVKPEEGEENREGEQLLDLFRETMLQSGHLGSAWGRTLEDESIIVWVIGMFIYPDTAPTHGSCYLPGRTIPIVAQKHLATNIYFAAYVCSTISIASFKSHQLIPFFFMLSIEWADSSTSVSLSRLEPFIDTSKNDPTNLITFYSTLAPSISETESLSTNPLTEIVTFAVPSDISTEDHKHFNNEQVALRESMLTKLTPESLRPLTLTRGQIERPAYFDHPDSPSGKALVYVNAVGWKSNEHHMTARETKTFGDNIGPIRKRVLSPVKGLDLKHVKFQKIGF